MKAILPGQGDASVNCIPVPGPGFMSKYMPRSTSVGVVQWAPSSVDEICTFVPGIVTVLVPLMSDLNIICQIKPYRLDEFQLVDPRVQD